MHNLTDPKTAYTYDALRRVKTATNSEGTTTSTYNDWEVQVEDANGELKDYIYDARGNLIGVNEYLSSTPYSTDYTYDSNNNLTKIEDADGNEQEMTYDFLGRKLTEELLHDPSEGSPNSYSFQYDANGNMTSQTDAKSQTVNYTYDELDRVLTENTTEVTYTYDTATNGIGRLDTVTSAGGSKSYDYDLRGYITDESKVINSVTYNTDFTYDLLGSVLTVTYPDSTPTTVTYGYNNAGQIEEIDGYVDDFDYSTIDTVAYIDFANGITTTNTYDPAHLYRLTDKVTTDGVDNLQDLTYTFDAVGNITAIADDSDTNTAKDAAYVYDDLHRLTSATITNTANSADYTHTYTYGITGNINSKSDVGSYTYANIHPQAVTSDGTSTYTYDNNGSLTSDGTWTHSYDTRNRLTQSADGSSTITYTYDEGRTRMTKSDGTTTTTYVNDYFEKEGAIERLFIFANNLKVAGIIDGNDVFYHEDHLSGSNISTDDTGAQLELNDYYPYGSSRIEDRATGYTNDYLFTGQERDEETDLYYYGARYYDPVLGRFTGVDEWKGNLIDPQSLNKFAYSRNNPLKYFDPSGNELKIAGSDAFVVQAQADLRKISPYVSVNMNNQVTFDSVQFTKALIGGEVQNPTGTLLLSSLIANQATTTIGQTDSNIIPGQTLPAGNNVDLVYNPDALYAILEYNANTDAAGAGYTKNFLILGHELIHALHFLTDYQDGDAEYTGLDGDTYKASYEEIRTVGSDENFIEPGEPTENKIREENGINKRNSYTEHK